MSNFSPVDFASEYCEVIEIAETTLVYSDIINEKQHAETIGWLPDNASINNTIKRVVAIVRFHDGAEKTYTIYNAGFELEIGDKIALLFATSDDIPTDQLIGLRNFTRSTQTRFTNFESYYSIFHSKVKTEEEDNADKGNQIGWVITSFFFFLWLENENPVGAWQLSADSLFLMVGQFLGLSIIGGYFFRAPISWLVTKLLSTGNETLIEREYEKFKTSIHQQLDDILV